MRKIAIVLGCLLAIFAVARAADVENPFRPPAVTCTNQFIRSVAALTGVGTCATVNFASDGTGLVPLANGGTNSINVGPTAWTPTDGSTGSLTFTGVSASYTRIGNMVFAYSQLTYPSTADTSNATIAGFPIAAANAPYAKQCSLTLGNATANKIAMNQAATTAVFLTTAGANVTNAQLSTATVIFICTYPVA